MKNFLKKLSITGIVVGAVADIVVTNILVIPIFLYALFVYKIYLLPADQISNHLTQVVQHDVLLLVFSEIFGSLASVLGGYIAATFVKKYHRLNAILASFLCVIFTLLSIGQTQWYWIIVGLIANPLLTGIGGQIRYMQQKHKR